jgi:hypothetical protein
MDDLSRSVARTGIEPLPAKVKKRLKKIIYSGKSNKPMNEAEFQLAMKRISEDKFIGIYV